MAVSSAGNQLGSSGKASAPLERLTIPDGLLAATANLAAHRNAIIALNVSLRQSNSAVQLVKERTAVSNPASVQHDLSRLNAIKARHTPEIARCCDEYKAARAAKLAADGQRDKAKDALQHYRVTVFPTYENYINEYLSVFRRNLSTRQSPSGGYSRRPNLHL